MTGIRKFKTVVTSSLLCCFLVWPNLCFPFFLFFFFLTRLRCTWEVRDDFPSANFSNKIVLFRVSLKYNDDDDFIYLFRHFIYWFISIIKITLSPIIPNLSKSKKKYIMKDLRWVAQLIVPMAQADSLSWRVGRSITRLPCFFEYEGGTAGCASMKWQK